MPDGYAVYKVKHDWAHGMPRNELKLQQLIATTPDATAALWRFVLDVDLIATVKAWDRPLDEELLWIAAEPRRMHFMVSDGLVGAPDRRPGVPRRASIRRGRTARVRDRRWVPAPDLGTIRAGRGGGRANLRALRRGTDVLLQRAGPRCGLPGWIVVPPDGTSPAGARAEGRRTRPGRRDVRLGPCPMVRLHLLSRATCA